MAREAETQGRAAGFTARPASQVDNIVNADNIQVIASAISAILGAIAGLIAATYKARATARESKIRQEAFWKEAAEAIQNDLNELKEDCNKTKKELEGKITAQRKFYSQALRRIAHRVEEEAKKSEARARALEDCLKSREECEEERRRLQELIRKYEEGQQ